MWDDTIRKWYFDIVAKAFGIPADKLDAYPPGKEIECPTNWNEQRQIEWAKQLAFFAFGEDLDFANMQIELVDGKQSAYKIEQIQEFDWDKGPDALVYVDVEIIYLTMYYDPYGDEITPLGYSKLINKLLVGPSKKLPKLEWIE